jgi:hypothetical protein
MESLTSSIKGGINGAQWLTPTILATQEAEMRKIGFEANLGK